MDSLYSRSEEILIKSLISAVPMNRIVIALAKVTRIIHTAPNIPVALRPNVLLRLLRILRDIENEKNLLDLCFAEFIPHPTCGERRIDLGEIWTLPLDHEWLCEKCGRPLYDIRSEK